jgi:hypothetical protein
MLSTLEVCQILSFVQFGDRWGSSRASSTHDQTSGAVQLRKTNSSLVILKSNSEADRNDWTNEAARIYCVA